jgi:hypothetical protein
VPRRLREDELIRVLDESGEDYLFSASQFEVVEFPDSDDLL